MVFDEHGRLTGETIADAERILASRPDLLERLVDELATILRDAARRPAQPARAALTRDDAPLTDENLPEEVPALHRHGERTQ